jgi:hypothetical protein
MNIILLMISLIQTIQAFLNYDVCSPGIKHELSQTESGLRSTASSPISGILNVISRMQVIGTPKIAFTRPNDPERYAGGSVSSW